MIVGDEGISSCCNNSVKLLVDGYDSILDARWFSSLEMSRIYANIEIKDTVQTS